MFRNTVNSRFKKDLKLQIHLYKAFFLDDRFLNSLHKSLLNQTTLDLRKEKWTFLNQEFTVYEIFNEISDWFWPQLCNVNQKWSYLHNIFRPPWSPVYSDKCNFAGHWHKQPILGDNRVGHASKNQPDTFCNIGLQQEFDFAEGSWKIKRKKQSIRIVWIKETCAFLKSFLV